MTHTLVPSDRIEGAPVCAGNGERIGYIERLMLDKRTGQVAYAVLRCGNALSPPPHHFPVPWEALRYNPGSKAYETDISIKDLRAGPNELDGDAFDWGDRKPPDRNPHYWTV